MRFIIYFFLLCALTMAVRAREVRVAEAEVTEVGIYTSRVVRVTSNADVIQGKLDWLDGFTLIQSTTNVPARIGTRFGFRFRVLGSPPNAPIVLRVVGKHPPFTNPGTGKTTTRDEYELPSWIGDTYTSFSFDEEWELVVGEFTFEIWHEDKKLCKQSFMVVEDNKVGSSSKRGVPSP